MKISTLPRIFALFCLFATVFPARAANPTFGSFSSQQFSVAGNVIGLKVTPGANTNALFVNPDGSLSLGSLLSAAALQPNKPVYTDGGTNLVSTPTAGSGPTKYLKFNFPRYVDGTGCTIPNTNDFTSDTFMVPMFSGTAVSNANFCRFAIRVPEDLDTSADLHASLTMTTATSSSSDQYYDLSVADVASSIVPSANPPSQHVSFIIAGGPLSINTGQICFTNDVVLPGWKSSVTNGHWMVIELERRGSETLIDLNNGGTYFRELEISYRATQ